MIAEIRNQVSSISKKSSRRFGSFTKRARRFGARVEKPLRRNPILVIFGLIVVLFILIFIGSQLRTPQITEEAVQSEARVVPVFYTGQLPSVTTTATIEKSGVLQVVAQQAGVVQSIAAEPGSEVSKGQTLIRLSSTYAGGSIPSTQRALTQRQYEQAKVNREIELERIALQRQIATSSAQRDEDQRKIQVAALQETREILDLTELQLKTVDDSLSVATASADIQQLTQQKAQLLASASQLKSTIRSLDYSDPTSNPPAQLIPLNREVTLRQLELQQQSLDLSVDVAKFQLQLARLQEALLYPAAPFPGTVQRVFVRPGESVSPGQVLATISCDVLATQVVAKVSPTLASEISSLEPSTITIGETKISLYPDFISSVATDGSLHTVLFTIPEEYFYSVTNDSYITVELPLRASVQSASSFIPLDAVYQSENNATVLVISDDGVAETRTITLGLVAGRFVTVVAGLEENAVVILDRKVVAGDRVLAEESLLGE